jgi:hypothetical protein
MEIGISYEDTNGRASLMEDTIKTTGSSAAWLAPVATERSNWIITISRIKLRRWVVEKLEGYIVI